MSSLLTKKQQIESFNDDAIRSMVRNFYLQVQQDPLIGPVFARRIDDWEPHLERMIAFWTSILRGEPGYTPGPNGGPPAMHRNIEELQPLHFDRWLELFETVLKAEFNEHETSYIMTRAQRMRKVLSAHLQPTPA